MAIETKQSTDETIYALTADNVMDSNFLIIPQQTFVREAARLLHRKRSHVAAVVDASGRCAGMLRAADVFRWIDADYRRAVVGTPVNCPYQVQGRLLNGDEKLICTLSHGRCEFQAEVPTTGGRHTDVCVRQETADFPLGSTQRYMTTDFVSISSRAKLLEMVLQLVDTRAEGLLVLDEFDRPAGIVSAKDILIAVVDRMRKIAKAGKERSATQKPK